MLAGSIEWSQHNFFPTFFLQHFNSVVMTSSSESGEGQGDTILQVRWVINLNRVDEYIELCDDISQGGGFRTIQTIIDVAERVSINVY